MLVSISIFAAPAMVMAAWSTNSGPVTQIEVDNGVGTYFKLSMTLQNSAGCVSTAAGSQYLIPKTHVDYSILVSALTAAYLAGKPAVRIDVATNCSLGGTNGYALVQGIIY